MPRPSHRVAWIIAGSASLLLLFTIVSGGQVTATSAADVAPSTLLVPTPPGESVSVDARTGAVLQDDLSSPGILNPLPTTYGNTTFVLPHYATLHRFLDVMGASVDQADGDQTPILSWTADGVFYVASGHELVFYNFATKHLTHIASWVPLFEDYESYNGVPNTEFITQDGSEIYTMGCPTSCQLGNPNIEVEVANVSSGVVWNYSFVGLDYHNGTAALGNTYSNAEVLVVGTNGRDDEVVVVDDQGTMWQIAVGAALSVSPTRLGTLSYFEANNLDWMPTLDSFINEEAGGATTDYWEQLHYTGTSVQTVANGSWASGVKSEFADAGGYNITAGEWSLTAGICSKREVIDGYLPISGGVSQAFQRISANDSANACPYAPPRPPLNPGGNLGLAGGSSDRVPITAAGPFVAEGWNNTSAILNPVNGQWSTLGPAANPGIYGPSQTYSTAELFHNGSYLISPRSNACDVSCSLLGQAGATRYGSEWWLWNSALPEFPYPANASLSEPSLPATPSLSFRETTTTATITWSESNSSTFPLLNYTLCWSLKTASCSHWLPLMPWTRSVTLTGLRLGDDVNFSLRALNFHYFSAAATGAVTTAGVRQGGAHAPSTSGTEAHPPAPLGAPRRIPVPIPSTVSASRLAPRLAAQWGAPGK